MCVILACKNKKPSLEILNKCHGRNSDGAGVGWFNSDGKVQYRKGLLDSSEVYKFIQHLELPFVIHFRAASIGGKSLLLTHPFEVTKESVLKMEGSTDKVVFHNGHVSDWEIYLAAANIEPDNKQPMSDTRAMAMIAANDNTKFLRRAKGHYVVMDSKDVRFYLYGKFDEEDGIAYSNLFWKYYGENTNSSYNRNSSHNGTTYFKKPNCNQMSDYYGEDGEWESLVGKTFSPTGCSSGGTKSITIPTSLDGLSKKQRKKMLKRMKKENDRKMGEMGKAPEKIIPFQSEIQPGINNDIDCAAAPVLGPKESKDSESFNKRVYLTPPDLGDLSQLSEEGVNMHLGFGS